MESPCFLPRLDNGNWNALSLPLPLDPTVASPASIRDFCTLMYADRAQLCNKARVSGRIRLLPFRMVASTYQRASAQFCCAWE